MKQANIICTTKQEDLGIWGWEHEGHKILAQILLDEYYEQTRV